MSMDMDASAAATVPVVRLTPSAAQEVKSLLAKPENAGKTLRVAVEPGGCSGMQFTMSFDERHPEDLVEAMHGVSVLVDPSSAQRLQGAWVDFSDSLMGGGFKLSNPNARQSCGCGKSFTA